jgi:hypothetical protein
MYFFSRKTFYVFLHGAIALVGHDFLIIETSQSHSETPQSVEFLWTSDQPDAGTSTWQRTTKETDFHDSAGFEPTIPASEKPQTHALDRAAPEIGTENI